MKNLTENEYEKLKSIAEKSIKFLENQGWEFTPDEECPKCLTSNRCEEHKWICVRHQVGVTIYPNKSIPGKDFMDPEVEDIRDEIASELVEELKL